MKKKSILYILPVPLSDQADVFYSIPSGIKDILPSIDGIIVEDSRRGPRTFSFLGKKLASAELKPNLKVEVLNEHSRQDHCLEILAAIKEGEEWALMSDAGCAVCADPGSDLVLSAKKRGIQVKPLVGPCSILLALMASGFSGQEFTFHGYLSKDSFKRREQLKQMEKKKGTQIFMETPYRNLALFQDALKVLNEETYFCVAVDLTLDTEEIVTKKIEQWLKSPLPQIQKRPTVFLISSLLANK